MTTSFKVYQIKNGNINRLAKEMGRCEAAMSQLLILQKNQFYVSIHKDFPSSKYSGKYTVNHSKIYKQSNLALARARAIYIFGLVSFLPFFVIQMFLF